MTNVEGFSWRRGSAKLVAWGNRLLGQAASALIVFYRWWVSPWLGTRCRFLPSCSLYALEAIALHGPWRGVGYGLLRLCRCHPWGSKGYCHDPVPGVTAQVRSFIP